MSEQEDHHVQRNDRDRHIGPPAAPLILMCNRNDHRNALRAPCLSSKHQGNGFPCVSRNKGKVPKLLSSIVSASRQRPDANSCPYTKGVIVTRRTKRSRAFAFVLQAHPPPVPSFGLPRRGIVAAL